jgi:hypothetical protein
MLDEAVIRARACTAQSNHFVAKLKHLETLRAVGRSGSCAAIYIYIFSNPKQSTRDQSLTVQDEFSFTQMN